MMPLIISHWSQEILSILLHIKIYEKFTSHLCPKTTHKNKTCIMKFDRQINHLS